MTKANAKKSQTALPPALDVAQAQTIPIICVSYNSAELISDLLSSLRKHYNNPVHIIDGSDAQHYQAIEKVARGFENVRFVHFDYNIHHGPGMAWAIQNLDIPQGRVLFLDSDVLVLHAGFLEDLCAQLQPGMYGVGMVNHVNEEGFDVNYEKGAIKYLHPACMLCNIEVMRQWPMPIKHGAPMTATMSALHKANASHLLGHVAWVAHDFAPNAEQKYLRHDWRGTVTRTGGYHLDEWQKDAVEAADFQKKLLNLMPANAKRVVQAYCGSGVLARAYKALYPACQYLGIEPQAEEARLGAVSCDQLLQRSLEQLTAQDFAQFERVDCWLLGDVLATLPDPGQLLTKIRHTLAPDGCIVATVPNAQHWMLQAKLSVGDFRYEDTGLLRRAYVRLFTRATLLELFQQAGFRVDSGFPRITSELKNESVIAAIKLMASGVGANPELALQDALAVQYVIKAVPV